ncbi:MAG: serine/threonine protein kinase [Planctomycetes bacterium]|nr:serine/threonine protein kinase [Planctomycetota bacterium]
MPDEASQTERLYTPAKPGTKLAGYNVLAEVGRGAASIIYLVQDPKTKQVKALKHVEKADPKDQRFLDQAEIEYEVSSKVRHPLVRQIERVIKEKEGLLGGVRHLYLVMEYVDGISIERKPPGTFEGALKIFIQTARGLAAMHKAGFVHADMKPNNIVVLEDGAIRIIDLGQACPIGTVKERIQGTPDYIAPEQVHRRAITPKTDIYNLGATMYWVLTRQHIPTAIPKESNSLVSTIDDAFIAKPKPVMELNKRVAQIPALNDLIMECVEVDPEKRPEDMDGVAQRLEGIAEWMKANLGPPA